MSVLGGALASIAVAASDRQPLSAAEVYTAEMDPEEVSRVSQGVPGQIAPPCPDAGRVEELKQRGLAVGPCDPVPEDGQGVLLNSEADPKEFESDGTSCPVVIGTKANPDLNFALDCAPGAKIFDVYAVESADEVCLSAAYLPSETSIRVEEILCPGDVPRTGGVAVGAVDDYAMIQGQWVKQ